jgi:hypothetical protein
MTAATTQIQRPQRVYAEFWPANVLMPDGTIRRKVRAYLTDTGVHLFFTKPTDELAPGFTAAIDFEATDPPNLHAFNVGVDIALARQTHVQVDGQAERPLMVITPTGGCGCGNTLKTWRPTWSHEVSPWPTS